MAVDLSGASDFAHLHLHSQDTQQAKAQGIKPMFGCEADVAEDEATLDLQRLVGCGQLEREQGEGCRLPRARRRRSRAASVSCRRRASS